MDPLDIVLQSHDGAEAIAVNDDGSGSGMNDELDKNIDAEEDFEFCYNCHSWEHNTKDCTIEVCKIGTVGGVEVGCGEHGHTRTQCTKNPLNQSINCPQLSNVNLSTNQKTNDKTKKAFPINIRLLRNKDFKRQLAKKSAENQNQSNETKSNGNINISDCTQCDQNDHTTENCPLRKPVDWNSIHSMEEDEIEVYQEPTNMPNTQRVNILTLSEDKGSIENPLVIGSSDDSPNRMQTKQEPSASPTSVASSQSSSIQDQQPTIPKWKKSQDPNKSKCNKSSSDKQNGAEVPEVGSIDNKSLNKESKILASQRESRYPTSKRRRSSSSSKSPTSASPDRERPLKRLKPLKRSKSPKNSRSPKGSRSSRKSKSPRYSKSPRQSVSARGHSGSPKGSSRSPRGSTSPRVSRRSKKPNSSIHSISKSKSSSSTLQKSIQKQLEIDSSAVPDDWDQIDPVVRPIRRSPGGSRYKSPSPLKGKRRSRSSSASLSPSPPPSIRDRRYPSPLELDRATPLLKEQEGNETLEKRSYSSLESTLKKQDNKRGSWSPSPDRDLRYSNKKYPLSPTQESRRHYEIPKEHSKSRRKFRSRTRSRSRSPSLQRSCSYSSRSPPRKRSHSPVVPKESHVKFLERLVSIGQGTIFPSTTNLNPISLQSSQQQIAPLLLSPLASLGLSMNQPPPSNLFGNPIQDIHQPPPSPINSSSVNLLATAPFMGQPLVYPQHPPLQSMSTNLPQNHTLDPDLGSTENELSTRNHPTDHSKTNEPLSTDEISSSHAKAQTSSSAHFAPSSSSPYGAQQQDTTSLSGTTNLCPPLEYELVSCLIQIDGLLNTSLRREDVINQLALLGFMIGKAFITTNVTSLNLGASVNVNVQFRTKAIAICFIKRVNGRFMSKKKNVSYINAKSANIAPISNYGIPLLGGGFMHAVVGSIGIKIGIYPVNEYQYQIRPEVLSLTIRDETFVMEFETKNYVQKKDREEEFKRFVEKFSGLFNPNLKKQDLSNEYDKAILVFENARKAKMFWLWIYESAESDFAVIKSIVECYGFGDCLTNDLKKDINCISQMECKEVNLDNPTHMSSILDDLVHTNISKNQNYLARTVAKDFKYTRDLKSSLNKIWLSSINEIIVVFVSFKFVMVNNKPYLSEIQLISPRTDKSCKCIYVRPATINGKTLENTIGYTMDNLTGHWMYYSKVENTPTRVVNEKEALKLMIEYLSALKKDTNRSLVLFTSSSYVNVPLLLLAFERHFDLLSDFLSLICGISDLLSLTRELCSEVYEIWGHEHIIAPDLETIHPIDPDEHKTNVLSAVHLYKATKTICREFNKLDAFLLEHSVSFEQIHLSDIQASEDLTPQSNVAVKSQSFKKVILALKGIINLGQPLVCLTKKYDEIGLEISEMKLLGSSVELTIHNNSEKNIVINKGKTLGHIIPNPYNVKWPCNLKWLPDCVDMKTVAHATSRSGKHSHDVDIFDSTFPIRLRKMLNDESNMILPQSTTLYLLGNQKQRKVVPIKQNLSATVIQEKIQVFFISMKVKTTNGEHNTIQEICLVNDKGERSFHSHAEHLVVLKEFFTFLANQKSKLVLVAYKIYFLFKTLETMMRQKNLAYYQMLNNSVRYYCDLEWCLQGELVSKAERGLTDIASRVLRKELKDPPVDAPSVCALVYELLRLHLNIPLSSITFLERCCLERDYADCTMQIYNANNLNPSNKDPPILFTIQPNESTQYYSPSTFSPFQEFQNNEQKPYSPASLEMEEEGFNQTEKELLDAIIEDAIINREVKNYRPKESNKDTEKDTEFETQLPREETHSSKELNDKRTWTNIDTVIIEDAIINREVKNYRPKEGNKKAKNDNEFETRLSREELHSSEGINDKRTWTNIETTVTVKAPIKDPRLRRQTSNVETQLISPPNKPSVIRSVSEVVEVGSEQALPIWCKRKKLNVIRDKDEIAIVYATFLKSGQKQYLTSLHVFLPNIGGQVFKVDSVTPTANWPPDSEIRKHYKKNPHAPEWNRWILKECTVREPTQKTEAEAIDAFKTFLENLEEMNHSMRLTIAVLVPSHVHYLENVLGRYDMRFETHFLSVSKWCDLTTFVYNNFTDNSMHWKAPDENLGKLEELYFHVFNRHPDPRQMFKPKLMYDIFWKLTCEELNFPPFYQNNTHIFKLDETKNYLYINIHLSIELINGEEEISAIGIYNALNKQGNISEFPQRILIPLSPKQRHEEKWERLPGFHKLNGGRWGYRENDKMVKCKSEKEAITTMAHIINKDCINWKYDGIILIFLDHKGFPHLLNATVLHGLEDLLLKKLAGVGDVATITQCLDEDSLMSSQGRLPSLTDLESNYYRLLKMRSEESTFQPFSESNAQNIAKAGCMLFFGMKRQKSPDKKVHIPLHHIASPLRSPYVNMLLYKSEIPIFREGFGSILIRNDVRLHPSSDVETKNEPISVQCILTGIIFGNVGLEFIIDKDPESPVEVYEDKLPLSKSSIFDVSITYNGQKTILLPAGTKIGVAKTGSLLAWFTNMPKKKPASTSAVTKQTDLNTFPIDVDTENQVDEDVDSDSDLRDQFLENKESNNLSSPTTERDLSSVLSEVMDKMEQAVIHLVSPPGVHKSPPKEIPKARRHSNSGSKFEEVTIDENEAATSPSCELNDQQTLDGIGSKLVEQTDFLTKSCYPNLRPLYEMYCLHCIKTDKNLSDKDVIGVADDITQSLASNGIEDISELENVVIDESGNEREKKNGMEVLLEKCVGLDNLLEEHVLNLSLELIYDCLRSKAKGNKRGIIYEIEQKRLRDIQRTQQQPQTSNERNNPTNNVYRAGAPKSGVAANSIDTAKVSGQDRLQNSGYDRMSLKALLNLDGSTKNIYIGKIVDFDSAFYSVKIPSKGTYEVSRRASLTSRPLSLNSVVIVTMQTENKCLMVFDAKSWEQMNDCYYGFVEENVGKNMVTVAFFEREKSISIALVSKKSSLVLNGEEQEQIPNNTLFSVGTRVAICVERNQGDELKKHGKIAEYKGILLFKRTAIETGRIQESYQTLIHGSGQFSEEKLSNLTHFFPSDVNFHAGILHNPSQNEVLLVTTNEQHMLIVYNTILKAENHTVKHVPNELRNNVQVRNQVFTNLVESHHGVSIRLNIAEDKILIACPASAIISLELLFDMEVKKCRDVQLNVEDGYNSSDSMEYEPFQDDDEIMSKKMASKAAVSNTSKDISGTEASQVHAINNTLSTRNPIIEKQRDLTIANESTEVPNPLNRVTENVAKMLSEKMEERKKRMEGEEKDLKVTRGRSMNESDFNISNRLPNNNKTTSEKPSKPPMTAFERYFGRFKSRPNKSKGDSKSENISTPSQESRSEAPPKGNDNFKGNSSDDVREKRPKFNKSHSLSDVGAAGCTRDVDGFLKVIRQESNLPQNNRKEYSNGKSPIPLRKAERNEQSQHDYEVLDSSTDSHVDLPFDICNDFEQTKTDDILKKCSHSLFPEKLCADFFKLGRCINGKECKNAHNIHNSIKIDYCFKYIDQVRKRECSAGKNGTKCGKKHLSFGKLQRRYKTQLQRLRTTCEQCGIEKKAKNEEGVDNGGGGGGGGGGLSDVSSSDDNHELSPNRFAVKNEYLKGNTSSKSAKCTNCPASDELCVTFVGIKCQHIPKCYKAHKIPNRMSIRYCSEFLTKDTFCSGNCGDPHIKFERLRSIYKEETQIMYKSCAICSSNIIDRSTSHRRSISQTPSDESLKSNNLGIGTTRRSSPPVQQPLLTNKRIVAYESDAEEGNDHESSTQRESSSQRSSSPRSSSSKEGFGGMRRPDRFTRTCKYYQQGSCHLGSSCTYLHMQSSERK